MTPNHIAVLLCYTQEGQSHAGLDRSMVNGCEENLFAEELIMAGVKDRGPRYIITMKGRAMITTLCNVPLPRLREAWIDANGEVIDV